MNHLSVAHDRFQRRPAWRRIAAVVVALLAAAQLPVDASIPARTPAPSRATVATSGTVRVTFRQLYFPPGRKRAAVRALATLAADPESSSATAAADHDLLPSRFDDVTTGYVSELFGKAFGEALQNLPVGRWSGPIHSELGWHLLWIDSVSTKPTSPAVVESSTR